MAAGTLSGARPLSTGRVMTILGAVTAGFSFVVLMLVLFVIPGACSFLGSLEVLMLGLLLIAGLIVLLIGRILERRAGNL